jgi:hypothetical protein
MKATDLLEKIQTLLSAKVQLAEMKLENGTVLEAESFATGESVFIVTEDDKVALPVGEYELEDGRALIVEEEGIIAEVKAMTEAQEEEEEVKEEAEMSAEDLAEVEVEVEPESYDSPAEAEKAEDIIQAVVDAVAPAIEEITEELGKMKEEMEKIKMEYDKKKEEMSSQAPATKPLKHSPESGATSVRTPLASKRARSTTDVVFAKMFNK